MLDYMQNDFLTMFSTIGSYHTFIGCIRIHIAKTGFSYVCVNTIYYIYTYINK